MRGSPRRFKVSNKRGAARSFRRQAGRTHPSNMTYGNPMRGGIRL